MTETTPTQYDPNEATVEEVNGYLLGLDDDEAGSAEFRRVLEAERAGQARKGILQHAGKESIANGDDADPSQPKRTQTTKATTFSDAAKEATPAPVGYVGTSAEAERTGRADKGLSQRNPAVMKGGPIPDPRQGVDDTAGLAALSEG